MSAAQQLDAAATREAAARWVMAEDAGLDASLTAARDSWLAEHPDHVAAYDAVRQAMGRADAIAADPRMLALRASALTVNRPARAAPWRIAASIVAVAVVLGGGAAINAAPSARTALLERLTHPSAQVYHTAIGERSTVTLPDGSVATLNTDTVLRLVFNKKVRGVQLVRGQAVFEVAHARARPFEVYAGDRVVTAIGTVFDVRLDAGRVQVALLEGKVRVGDQVRGAAPSAAVVMAPGELLEASPARPMTVRNENVERETSWRSGVLLFDETPLAAAVAELNRYSERHLVVDDPALAAHHVSGAFKTGDVERFAETVAEIAPVSIQARADGSILLAPKG